MRESVPHQGHVPHPAGTQRRYPGRELEAMAFAVNYHRWIFDAFVPYLGKRVLEVGAGAGSFSEILLESDIEHLLAIEPSDNMFPALQETLREQVHAGRADAHPVTLTGLATAIGLRSPDTIVYLNVLEHIEDDLAELRTARSLIAPGGHLLIFVPAHEWLMSPIDRQFGHHRRYSLRGLEEICRAAGFEVVAHRHFDLFGIVPWWLRYRLLGSKRMEPSAVRLYDRYVVPIARAAETRFPAPIGKNILMACRAPDPDVPPDAGATP